VERGAALANYVECLALLKEDGKVRGARLRDRLSGKEWELQAKVVINATGPFGDELRRLDDPEAKPLLNASSGVHIVLARRYSPDDTGLLIPKTEDGRVLFTLPWLGHTLVGTTDNPAPITRDPQPTEDEIQYILRQLKKYFALDVPRGEILAAWSGLRPLVSQPKKSDTAGLSRDHVVNASPSGLITAAGGKWTTYRKMALDTVDYALRAAGIEAGPSQTEHIPIAGGADWKPDGAARLEKEFGLAKPVAKYLHRAYGDRAARVALLAREGLGQPLSPGHPCLEAEVVYAAREEAARTVLDVLGRRLRMSFLDRRAARNSIPRVAQLLASVLGWSEAQCAAERRVAEEALA
jgi:glycerol-3-phosphate dehydrogenase